ECITRLDACLRVVPAGRTCRESQQDKREYRHGCECEHLSTHDSSFRCCAAVLTCLAPQHMTRRLCRTIPETREQRGSGACRSHVGSVQGTGVAQAAGGTRALPPVWFATWTNVSPTASCVFVLPPYT